MNRRPLDMTMLSLAIQNKRQVRGISQAAVAQRTGLSPKTISSYETGKRIGCLKVRDLDLIARSLGVGAVDILLLTEAIQ